MRKGAGGCKLLHIACALAARTICIFLRRLYDTSRSYVI
jgi:hypothetical protein